jgi:uncharacterized protein (DUF433 family)
MAKQALSTNDLIARYVEETPHYPGPADARLKEFGTAVWALVGYLKQAVAGDVAQAAKDYDVPLEAVQAALAYYRQDEGRRKLIDARITSNAA